MRGPAVSVALLAAALQAPAALAAQTPAPDLDAFREYVRQGLVDWEVPGLAIAVVKDGDVVFEEAFGVRALGSPAPTTVGTLFAIGSTTKAMTAAAVAMLVDEGKLGWDDRVAERLPGFRLHDPYVTAELRVRDLLTHNAGLGNADFLWYEKDVTTGEILERIGLAEPAYSFRAGFIYQNIMYAAAGELVATVSGMPWAEFVRTRIFAPLGMDGAVTTLAEAERRPDVARPHDRVDGTVVEIENASVDPVASAGSVWAGVADMARWMRFLLAGGVAPDGTRLLSEAVVAELFRPQVIVPADQFYPTARLTGPHWTTYALGWFQQDYRGRAVDFHTGSIDGMVAIHGLIRDEGLGVYVLANLDHAELRHALMLRVFDLFGEGEGRDWSRELLDLYGGLADDAERARLEAEAARVDGTSPSLEPGRYAGTYTDPLRGVVRVSDEAGGLRIWYGDGLQGPLTHWHYDTFRAAWDAGWRGVTYVRFVLDARSGDVAALEMNGSRFVRTDEP